MFRNILVPVDLTEKNAAAVGVARDLALQSDGEVTLLHVIETLDLPFEELEDFYLKLEEQAGRGMDELGRPLREAGVTLKQHICYGRRASEIVAYAEEAETDVIILSSHRLDPENPERGWATISHQVAILSQCPVLLVK
ncbi:MAG: universal stress protein [Gemmatimonadota bacterium]